MEIGTNIGYLISIFNRYTEIYRDKTFEDMYSKENEGRHGWPAREWYGNLRDQQSVYCSWNTDKKRISDANIEPGTHAAKKSLVL